MGRLQREIKQTKPFGSPEEEAFLSLQRVADQLTRAVADAVKVPVIAHGGAGSLDDFRAAIKDGHASAVAAGSMFVFQGPHRAVLVNYPAPDAIDHLFG